VDRYGERKCPLALRRSGETRNVIVEDAFVADGSAEGTVGYRILAGDRSDHQVIVDMSLIGLETSLGSLASGLIVESGGESTAWSDSFDLPTGKRRSSKVHGV
jgi:hypothetical protein